MIVEDIRYNKNNNEIVIEKKLSKREREEIRKMKEGEEGSIVSDCVLYKAEDDNLLEDIKYMIYNLLKADIYKFSKKSISDAKFAYSFMKFLGSYVEDEHFEDFVDKSHLMYFEILNNPILSLEQLHLDVFTINTNQGRDNTLSLKKVSIREYCLFFINKYELLDYKGDKIKDDEMRLFLRGIFSILNIGTNEDDFNNNDNIDNTDNIDNIDNIEDVENIKNKV